MDHKKTFNGLRNLRRVREEMDDLTENEQRMLTFSEMEPLVAQGEVVGPNREFEGAREMQERAQAEFCRPTSPSPSRRRSPRA